MTIAMPAMDRIGKYIVKSELISTGFSDIHLCFDPDLEVNVAVKVFGIKGKNVGPKAKYGEAFWRDRFIREARLLARLDHPHIVSVKEMAVTAEGRPYFVMPFIEANLVYEIGKDVSDSDAIAALPEKQRPKRLPPERAIAILRQLLQALAELHRRQLVHRDVKPANLLLTRKREGSVKLCDFGMVKFPDTKSSRAGIWVGTLDYIAPEQRESATTADARADVYAAAALAYRMLAGTLAVGAFPRLGELGVQVPRALDELVTAALAREKEKRPADAAEMIRRLDQAWPARAAPPRRGVARVISISTTRASRGR